MYELTDVQINTFQQKGWIGPLDTFSIQEVEPVKKELEANSQVELAGEQKIRTFQNPHFEMKTTLNHHLYSNSLSDIFADKRIVSRLNQLGEPDLLLWRTNIFHTMPGQEVVGWHQAIDYYGYDADETKVELLFPEGESPLNLTVWIAFEDITPEMGILDFANGSHHKRFQAIKVPLGQGDLGGEKYYRNLDSEPEEKRYSKAFDFDEKEWEIESVPTVKAGQIIIFTEKAMHRGRSNGSSKERWAVNGRYIKPSVTVYPRRLSGDYIDNYGFDIRKHFCTLVSGSDNYRINQVAK
ncbi:MAG: phytanoyl-CoA dioxygenase family protein [Oscillatoria sp. PMC 1068.18]|nr:phytanoyl-CoA dioxygenase family protein [Oscillatoria sp. PMC 1076.18]MEC4991320.1 phytanoyl-CoA dioxygenase family protein [Oscillatoria sp. PMC 1068.18]